MDEKATILSNFYEYYELANFAFEQNKFNGAVTLYYKSLVELCDYALLEKTGKIGANHTERFELLEQYQPELYILSSKLFRFYRDSYSKKISATIARLVKENVDAAKKLALPEKNN